MLSALIVDDEPDIRALFRILIEQTHPGQVVANEAGNANEALAQCREQSPDVVVMDHRLPGRSGLEVAEEILRVRPGQRIILMTAHLSRDLEARARQVGISRCMEKDALVDLAEAVFDYAAADPTVTTPATGSTVT